jgi:hypothetical protein
VRDLSMRDDSVTCMVSAEFGAGINLKGILSNESGGSRIFA